MPESTAGAPWFSTGNQLIASDLQQTAAHGNGDGVGAVVGAKLVDDIFDVEVDGGFRDGEERGDFLVAVAVANQAQHFDFAGSQVVVPHKLRQAHCDLG